MGFLSRVLNLRAEEWPKVLRAFSLKFFYRASFVLGWTVLVAMFVSSYGISALPYLLILNAFFTVLGSAFYAVLLKRFTRGRLLLVSLLLVALCLFVARILFEFSLAQFFALLIVTEAVLLTQIRIMVIGLIEEMFSAAESERVFPIVESADTVGGVAAGIVLLTLSGVIASVNFIFLWIFAILGTLLFLVFGNFEPSRIASNANILSRFKEKFVGKKQFVFFKTLVAIVFLQWLLFNLMEFQYTVAVFESASDTVMEGGSGFEHAFIHDLGVVFILFSVSALLVQLLLGSRIIASLGVVGTLFLHALVTLVSVVGLIFSFNFSMAVFARNNFTMTTVLHMNAYISCYYAFRASFREDAREFIDGVVRPCGALFGAMLLLALKFIFPMESLLAYVSGLMIVAVAAMFYFITRQQKYYTELAVESLLAKGALENRLTAVDILSQKGHGGARKFLKQVAADKSAPEELRKRARAVIVSGK